MPNTAWTGKDITSQEGKLAIVTGATGGIGYETSLALAQAGATVILAGRNEAKGTEALSKIKAILPEAKISFGKVDLGSLASINEFCKEFLAKNQPLDILINNAGIMAPPKRETTSDGFEIQIGTNHLSHFALTAQLLPALRKSASGRVINVSSFVARQGRMNFDDLQYEKSYSAYGAYAQSKLANLLFTFELQRKITEGNWGITAIASHPGFSRTELVSNGFGADSFVGRISNHIFKPLFAQNASDGAWPLLYAATSEEAQPGGYYGPNGILFEMRGPVCPSFVPAAAKDLEAAKKLWNISVTLTKATWP